MVNQTYHSSTSGVPGGMKQDPMVDTFKLPEQPRGSNGCPP